MLAWNSLRTSKAGPHCSMQLGTFMQLDVATASLCHATRVCHSNDITNYHLNSKHALNDGMQPHACCSKCAAPPISTDLQPSAVPGATMGCVCCPGLRKCSINMLWQRLQSIVLVTSRGRRFSRANPTDDAPCLSAFTREQK